jgi:hypothetical protein
LMEAEAAIARTYTNDQGTSKLLCLIFPAWNA